MKSNNTTPPKNRFTVSLISLIAAALAILPILPLLLFSILLAIDDSNGPLGYTLFIFIPLAVLTVPLLSITSIATGIFGLIDGRPIDKRLSIIGFVLLGVNILLTLISLVSL